MISFIIGLILIVIAAKFAMVVEPIGLLIYWLAFMAGVFMTDNDIFRGFKQAIHRAIFHSEKPKRNWE